MKVQVAELCYSYGQANAIQQVNFDVATGSFVGIIGPNGSGKSTLLKNIYRALKADSGAVLIDQEHIEKLSYKESALKMAVVGQEQEIPFDFKVEEIVSMGRYVHKKIFANDTAEDNQIIAAALEKVGIAHLARQNFMHISGGEKQRVLIARAIAQNSQLIILDEPTNHLDIHYQLEIFSLLKNLGITVISAIHDLNLAAMYCDEITVMAEGQVLKEGIPENVLTADLLTEVFQVKAEVLLHPLLKRPVITYLGGESL